MMTQTLALFFDAYRELNAKRLFWFVLAISGLVVAAMAAIGIDESGFTILHWQLGMGPNTALMSREFFYKSVLFSGLGVSFWLAWLATILALISTAGIMPDFLAGGAIELLLCKPIGRLRLFLTKYLTGLLFVGLQVLVFTFASFLVIGLRAGVWEPGLFLAVPLVALFFSYLYCMCVLFGILTRSTIASLLLTLLFWFVLFGVHTAEFGLLFGEKNYGERVTMLTADISLREEQLTKAQAETADSFTGRISQGFDIASRTRALERRREQLDDTTKWHNRFKLWHSIAFTVKSLLPKTKETTELLQRTLASAADIHGPLADAAPPPLTITDDASEVRVDDERIAQQAVATLQSRSPWWVIGTSLQFEMIIICFAAWKFCRREF